MKRRFFGAVLAGLGVLFLILAIGLPFYVAPRVTKLPNDLRACPAPNEAQPAGCLKPSVAEAANATFLHITSDGAAIRQGTLRSTTEVLPRPDVTANWQRSGKLSQDAVVWDVYSSATWVETRQLVSAYSTELALHRVTGEALAWDGQWLDDADLTAKNVRPSNVNYSGQIYKFPFGTEKIDYQMFDRDLRKALPVKFKEVATVGGVEAYKFEQIIDKQDITPPASSLRALLSAFAPEATSGKVLYSNIREVWIEPVTGAFVDVRERPLKVLVPDVGSETKLLEADFRYTKSTVDNSVASASNNVGRLKLLTLYGPIVLGVLALLCIVGGALLMRRPAPQTFDGSAWQDGMPESRHRLRADGSGFE